MQRRTANSNPYTVLGITPGASAEEIEAAYNSLFDEYEPGANDGDETAIEMLEQLNEAHDTLTDRARRRELDARLGVARSGAAAGSPNAKAQPARSVARAPGRGAYRTPADGRPRSVQAVGPASPMPYILMGALGLALVVAVAFLVLRGMGGGTPAANGGGEPALGLGGGNGTGPTPTLDPSRGTVAATVNGFPIYEQDYNERFERDKKFILDDPFFAVLIGGNWNTVTGTRLLKSVRYESLDRLIAVEVLQHEAFKEGLYPTGEQQLNLIEQAKAQDLKSGISFQDFLKEKNITEGQYNRSVIRTVVVVAMADRHMPKQGNRDAQLQGFYDYICTVRKGYDIKINMKFEGDQTPCTGGLPQELPLPGSDTGEVPEPLGTTPPQQQGPPAPPGKTP